MCIEVSVQISPSLLQGWARAKGSEQFVFMATDLPWDTELLAALEYHE